MQKILFFILYNILRKYASSTENIFCKKAGQNNGYEWSLPFGNKDQYNQVMEFVHGLSEKEDLQFTTDMNFWQDFLMIHLP